MNGILHSSTLLFSWKGSVQQRRGWNSRFRSDRVAIAPSSSRQPEGAGIDSAERCNDSSMATSQRRAGCRDDAPEDAEDDPADDPLLGRRRALCCFLLMTASVITATATALLNLHLENKKKIIFPTTNGVACRTKAQLEYTYTHTHIAYAFGADLDAP